MVKRAKKKKKSDVDNIMSEINYILASASIPVKRPTKKQMNWTQAKKRFPKMDPMKDYDMDGVMNMFDCRPFNNKKQGMEHKYGFSSTGAKRIRTVKMKPETFLRETYKESEGTGMQENSYEEYKEKLRRSPAQTYEKKHKTAVEAIKDKIRSKKENVPIGFLDYDDNKPSSHEGRHTALAAKELGIKTIPVTVASYKKEEEPETSKLPLHRKQFPLHEWKDRYGETEEEYRDRVANRKADVIQYPEGEKPEALQSLEQETEDEEDDK